MTDRSSAGPGRLCELLGVDVPVIQTGMGWVSTPELVAATANAGGFGFHAAATVTVDDLPGELARIRTMTDRPFGVNFLMDAPGAEDKTEILIEHGARAAGYNRGPRPDLVDRLKSAGVLCVPTCGLARHAEKAEAMGADIVIMQGAEGGGHTGPVPTSLLLADTVARVDVPVVAAGGFHDGRGLIAALAYGAAGIAMGTRFLLTRDSLVPEAAAGRYLDASPTDIRVTDRIDGLPQRVVDNELVSQLESGGALTGLWAAVRSAWAFRKVSEASFPELLRSAVAMRRRQGLSVRQTLMAANAPMLAKRGVQDGDPVGGYLPSGTVAGVLDDRPSCQELLDRIMDEARATLAHLEAVELG